MKTINNWLCCNLREDLTIETLGNKYEAQINELLL